MSKRRDWDKVGELYQRLKNLDLASIEALKRLNLVDLQLRHYSYVRALSTTSA